jgi:hypothetical protein
MQLHISLPVILSVWQCLSFINVVAIAFILCSDPIPSMSSFVFCSVNWPNNCVFLCVMYHLLLLCVFVYVCYLLSRIETLPPG